MTDHLAKIVSALSDPAVYPQPPDSVQVIHTHISVVFIAGEFVYKVKKPLNLGFLDFSSLEKRRYFCKQEVLLNSRFSEGIYLGVQSIHHGPCGVNLAGEGEEIEVAVLMHRIPDDNVLLNLLPTDRLTSDILDQLADRIAFFHSEAHRGPHAAHFGSPEVIGNNLRENFNQVKPYIGRTIDETTHRETARRAMDFLEAHEALIRKRMREGFVRDCHGDLHLQHVILMGGFMLIDCIEFNDRFRYGDTVSDLAFLLMDLDFQGFPGFANRVAMRYARTAHDDDASKLLRFYKSYRAFIRGKVESFQLDDPQIAVSAKESAGAIARHYFDLSYALLEPVEPALIIMCGLMGTGKSYLAGKLSERLDADHFKSDVLRKEIHGLSPAKHRLDKYGKGIYTSSATDRTYKVLLERGRQSLQHGRSVVLDASFAQRRHRNEARKVAQDASARFRIIECSAPEHMLLKRLEARIKVPGESSDGRVEILKQQELAFQSIRVEERAHCREWDSTSDPHPFLQKVIREIMVH